MNQINSREQSIHIDTPSRGNKTHKTENKDNIKEVENAKKGRRKR